MFGKCFAVYPYHFTDLMGISSILLFHDSRLGKPQFGEMRFPNPRSKLVSWDWSPGFWNWSHGAAHWTMSGELLLSAGQGWYILEGKSNNLCWLERAWLSLEQAFPPFRRWKVRMYISPNSSGQAAGKSQLRSLPKWASYFRTNGHCASVLARVLDGAVALLLF